MNYLTIVRITTATIKSLLGGTLGAIVFPGYKVTTLAYMLIENNCYGSIGEAFYSTRYVLLLLFLDVAWYAGAFAIRMLPENSKVMRLTYRLIESRGYSLMNQAFHDACSILRSLVSDFAWCGGIFVTSIVGIEEGGAHAPSSLPSFVLFAEFAGTDFFEKSGQRCLYSG